MQTIEFKTTDIASEHVEQPAHELATIRRLRDHYLQSVRRAEPVRVAATRPAILRDRERQAQLFGIDHFVFESHRQSVASYHHALRGAFPRSAVGFQRFGGVRPDLLHGAIRETIGVFIHRHTLGFSHFDGIDFETGRRCNQIHGHEAHNADELRGGSVGFVGFFALTPERFPLTDAESFLSRPNVAVFGDVAGATGGYHWFWAADDKWSKCRLIIRHTIFMQRPTGNEMVLADSEIDARQLVDLQNASPIGQHIARLNFTSDANVLFHFPPEVREGVLLVARTEVRFDVQLEGEADIFFAAEGGAGHADTPENALQVCMPNWAIQPLD